VALIVLDASVVIAWLDAADAHHGTAVRALQSRRADEFVLPTSAYAETLVRPYQAGPAAVQAVEAAVGELALRLEPLTPAIARRAAALRARHRGLALPDAIVLATADALEAAAVLTTDRAWPRFSRRARAL
jgi:predicted nucleic acid-binding protein